MKALIYVLVTLYILFMIYVVILDDKSKRNNQLLNNMHMNKVIKNNLKSTQESSFSLSNNDSINLFLPKNKMNIAKMNNIEHFSSFNTASSQIPKIIYQTYHKKHKIPPKVYNNIKKYADGYEHIIYSDTDCIKFLNKHYNSEFSKLFRKIKSGPHKADFFRYCLLYISGGIYMDIKTELIKPVNEIFTTNDTYTVIDFSTKRIYQGIIATKPLNPIFLKLIKKFFEYDRKGKINRVRYQVFIRDFYRKIKSDCAGVKEGLNINKTNPNFNFFLFQEKCNTDSKSCYNGLDRYGLCCFIFNKKMEKMIKIRYSDYPW